jgi:cyclopropane-fatty-acyl-phospholipid synthase
MHARLEPVGHAFRYPFFFFAFDLDELPRLNTFGWLAGYNRHGVISVHDEDHFGRKPASIREKLLSHLGEAGIVERIGRVLMVTSARYFGHAFNPVSFFYCHREDGSLRCMVTEVNNTFGERHVYVLSGPEHLGADQTARFTARKEFHVSPFNDLHGGYEFQFSPPGETLDIRVDLVKEGRTTLKTQMRGNALELSPENLARTLLAYPFSALLTLPRIHWQAAKLYFGKKLAFHPKPVPAAANTLTMAAPSMLDRAAMRLVFPILRRINVGSLKIQLPDRHEIVFGDEQAMPQARMIVKDYRAFRRIATGGDVGLGESFTAGEWNTDDLSGLIQRLIENWHIVDEDAKAVRIGRMIGRLGHLRRGNTMRGSRKNISAHYDLGNDFFRLFLDETMMYSCAYYRDKNETLIQAQHNKIRMLIERAGITATDHVLEIGCGWGGFAIEAVRQTGCRVRAITISQQQYELASQRVREAGLEDRIRVELRDYRTLEGQFDKIVSVEMIEAVGHEFLGPFFAICDRVLKPEGTLILQAITIPHDRYDGYRNSVDWIRKHIFPGGHLPSVETLSEAMAQSTKLEIVDAEDIAPHYASTLRDWRSRFEAAREQLSKMGFDQAFYRKWIYYFALCEASFETRKLGLHHLVITRAGRPN